MSGAEELDAQGLAAAFRAHLEHLGQFKGARYGSAAASPRAQALPTTQGGPSEAKHADESAVAKPAPVPSEAPPREDIGTLQRRVRREQAQQWPAAKKLEYLRTKVVGDCTRCPLSRSRTKLVFGVGNPDARIVFVGEAPGRDEDQQGEPFVGAAGQRLDQWIEAIGLRREDVYIANVLKCRPPGNRDPHPKEVATCSPFVHAQLRAIAPAVVVALGRFAGNLLVGGNAPMYRMRESVHRYRDPKNELELPVVVTYHPSYVLRREGESKSGRPDVGGDGKTEEQKVLDDLQRAKNLLRA